MAIHITWHSALLDSSSLTNLRCVGDSGVIFANTVADLLAVSASLCLRYAFVYGWTAKNDGMGFEAYWDRASTETPDGTTIINPTGNTGAGRWIRRL